MNEKLISDLKHILSNSQIKKVNVSSDEAESFGMYESNERFMRHERFTVELTISTDCRDNVSLSCLSDPLRVIGELVSMLEKLETRTKLLSDGT